MSQMLYDPHMDTNESDAVYTAQRTRDMLTGVHIGLIEAINHNLTLPKPAHKNLPLMTTILRLEQSKC